MIKAKIGVDLDNTIISYDRILHAIASRKGFVSPEIKMAKKVIRDAVRRLPDGERKWQELQAMVYGPLIYEADLMEGVSDFFRMCVDAKCKVNIVSHKTVYANFDTTGTNLRHAALSWIEEHGLIGVNRNGIRKGDIYFEGSRREKAERIRRLECTHFIDDLEETFLESWFPKNVKKMLYNPHGEPTLSEVRSFTTWREICLSIFGAG
jgi:hypothetical protein